MRLAFAETAGPHITEPVDVVWRKAGRSHDTGACVELAVEGRCSLVRDSKSLMSTALKFDVIEWRSFVARIKRHELDLKIRGL